LSWFQENRSKFYAAFRWLVSPLVRGFSNIGMPPWVVSTAGLLFTVLAFVLMYRGAVPIIDGNFGWMRAAGAVLLFAAIWDTIDGELARRTGKASPKGAFLDSVLDRVSEFILFFGIFLFWNLSRLDSVLLFGLLFTSLSISYIRARAEGVGIECKIGIFDRATRVVILGVGMVLLPQYINWIIRILLAGTLFTALRRFVHVLSRK